MLMRLFRHRVISTQIHCKYFQKLRENTNLWYILAELRSDVREAACIYLKLELKTKYKINVFGKQLTETSYSEKILRFD